jgi:hypothetical protein
MNRFLASFIRRNVQPLYKSEAGLLFLGAVLHQGEYLDLYVSADTGEYLSRYGNNPQDYGCMGRKKDIEAMGPKAPAKYLLAIKLHERYLSSKQYFPCAYKIQPIA